MDEKKRRSPRGLVLTGLWLLLALTQLATLIGSYPQLGMPSSNRNHEPHWLVPAPQFNFVFAAIALPVFLALTVWQFRRSIRDQSMTYLRFGIRDLLWAMVVVGLGLGWWAERSKESDYSQITRVVSARTSQPIELIRFDSEASALAITRYPTAKHRQGTVFHLKKRAALWIIAGEEPIEW